MASSRTSSLRCRGSASCSSLRRNSPFTYKGRAVDIKLVGRELGVRYVLEGSVRKAANRLRITAQLIDAENGTQLWADRFDGPMEDVFQMQDEVTAKVVNLIAPRMRQSDLERFRRKPTERLDAYDCFLRGMATASDPSKWSTSEAQGWFRQAIHRDPAYAAAHSSLAGSIQQKASSTGVPLSPEERIEALELAERACTLANTSARRPMPGASASGHSCSSSTLAKVSAPAFLPSAMMGIASRERMPV